jgi:hypothetical protein
MVECPCCGAVFDEDEVIIGDSTYNKEWLHIYCPKCKIVIGKQRNKGRKPFVFR